MQWLARGLMAVVVAVASAVFVSGCDVEGQVLDTVGLAGQIVDVWLD